MNGKQFSGHTNPPPPPPKRKIPQCKVDKSTKWQSIYFTLIEGDEVELYFIDTQGRKFGTVDKDGNLIPIKAIMNYKKK